MAREPWERQPHETVKAYDAFCHYRDLDPYSRTVAAVARSLGQTGEYLRQVARKWRWVERAAAWDEERDRASRMAEIRALRQMRERHLLLAEALQSGASERLLQMQQPGQGFSTLSPSEVRQWVEAGIRLERQARGEPDLTVTTPRDQPIQTETQHDAGFLVATLAALEEAAQLPAGTARAVGVVLGVETPDAEAEQVHPGEPDAEADGVPAGQSP